MWFRVGNQRPLCRSYSRYTSEGGVGTGANQVQGWKAREQANFTIKENEFNVWEMGGVTRVESTSRPFMGS